jgi:hypothetical protein
MEQARREELPAGMQWGAANVDCASQSLREKRYEGDRSQDGHDADERDEKVQILYK